MGFTSRLLLQCLDLCLQYGDLPRLLGDLVAQAGDHLIRIHLNHGVSSFG